MGTNKYICGTATRRFIRKTVLTQKNPYMKWKKQPAK